MYPATGRLKVVVIGFGKIVVPSSILVLDGTGIGSLVDKPPHKSLDVSEIATAVVAHVNHQTVAGGDAVEYHIEVAVAYPVGEVAVVDVGKVVAQNLVLDSRGSTVVEMEVMLVDQALVVVDGILLPNPVPRHVEGGDEISVAVLQLLEHVAAQVKELSARDATMNLGAIALSHLLPVHILVGKEAVVLVEDGPQSVEVAVGVVLPLGLVVARGERQQCHHHNQYVDKALH